MKKVGCKKCGNFKGMTTSSILIKGKKKTEFLVDCDRFGELRVIGARGQIWISCSQYKSEVKMQVKSAEREKIRREICARIKLIRKALKLTQKEFGKPSNTSYMLLSRIEQGEVSPNLVLLASLCRDFNVDGNFLLTGEGEMFRETI